MSSMLILRTILVGAPILVLFPNAARGDTPILADDLQVVVLDGQIISIDGRSGVRVVEELDIGERVLWTGSRGQVGMAITNRRLLAVSNVSGTWQETRYRSNNAPPSEPLLGGHVGLVSTDDRIIGFIGPRGNLAELTLAVKELVLECRVSENVAVAVTDRRALGLSAFGGGFVEIKFDLHERIEGVSAVANSVTVRTDKRLLIFRAPTGTWEQQKM